MAEVLDSFPRLATVICPISRCNDVFPYFPFLFRHSINHPDSIHYGCVAK